MTYNTLTTSSFKIYKDKDIEYNKAIVLDLFKDIDFIYSYIIKSTLEKNRAALIIKFTISENIKHNTIKSINMLNKIIELLNNDIKTNDVVAYEQPNLNIIFKVYNKFIVKIAKKQSLMWHLEFDDVYQLCALSIIKLHKKNYFLNRYIIDKTCKNDILLSIRKNRNMPIIESLDNVISNDNIDNIRYADIIEDVERRYEFDDKINTEINKEVFNKVKEIIINKFGERKFDKLYKDYTNGHTDSISLTMMYKIRRYMKQRNITMKSLEGDKYESQ